jgi:hypothetical protein
MVRRDAREPNPVRYAGRPRRPWPIGNSLARWGVSSNEAKPVTVGGVSLAPGLYPFTQLTNAYPANFPASWPPQRGSSVTKGSGSIQVLGNAPPPVTLYFKVSDGNLILTWSQGTLLRADDVNGLWKPVLNATSPWPVPLSGSQSFYRVQVQ